MYTFSTKDSSLAEMLLNLGKYDFSEPEKSNHCISRLLSEEELKDIFRTIKFNFPSNAQFTLCKHDKVTYKTIFKASDTLHNFRDNINDVASESPKHEMKIAFLVSKLTHTFLDISERLAKELHKYFISSRPIVNTYEYYTLCNEAFRETINPYDNKYSLKFKGDKMDGLDRLLIDNKGKFKSSKSNAIIPRQLEYKTLSVKSEIPFRQAIEIIKNITDNLKNHCIYMLKLKDLGDKAEAIKFLTEDLAELDEYDGVTFLIPTRPNLTKIFIILLEELESHEMEIELSYIEPLSQTVNTYTYHNIQHLVSNPYSNCLESTATLTIKYKKDTKVKTYNSITKILGFNRELSQQIDGSNLRGSKPIESLQGEANDLINLIECLQSDDNKCDKITLAYDCVEISSQTFTDLNKAINGYNRSHVVPAFFVLE